MMPISTHIRLNRLFRPDSLSIAISMAVLASSNASLAQTSDQEEIEEVVVTGSFIRRSEGFTAASPVTQLDAEELQAEGTVNMAQVVYNMTFNNGAAVTSGIQGLGSDAGNAFNLRGLGSRATLQLMDGKRVSDSNVNLIMPSIGIQRMEIVTDGAAALYGTDAVAGVVNIIPYTQYDGAQVEYYEEGDSRGDYHDRSLSALFGTTLEDNIHVVAALSHRDQGELRWHDRPEHMNAGLTHNTGSHPGNFLAPVRDEDGFLTGEMAQRPDPTCGRGETVNPAQVNANPYGLLFGGRCWLDFGSTRNYRNPQTISQFYGNIEYDVNPDLTVSTQLNYSRQIRRLRANQANPGGRVDQLPTVRGEIPGNTFRAMSADGRELFAQPSRNPDGSLRTDGYGRALPRRGNDGQVLLADNQFVSMEADPLGGVPFYEDVVLEAWMPFGKTNTLPSGFNADDTHPELAERRTWRFATSAEFTVPYLDNWEGLATYTNSASNNLSRDSQVFSFSAMEQGLNCDVVNDVDACFNPFGLVDERFATPQPVADAIWGRLGRRDDLDALQTLDVVLNGTVPLGDFELPGGAIGAAFGYQRREEKTENVPAPLEIAGDQFIGTQEFPTSFSRGVNAGFLELAIPVLSNLELGVAVRNENFSSGQDSTIAKFGAVYEPTDWLAFRGTAGEAFIAPTLDQLFSSESCGLTNVDDLFTTFSGFIASCSSGNPELSSETSDSISLGVDLLPMEGMSLSVTWSETDFTDRIVSTTTQDIIRRDFANFQQVTGWAPTDDQELPPLELLREWDQDPRSDDRIVRDPRNIENVQLIRQNDSNASEMLVRAWDMEFDYSLPVRDWGTFSFNLQGTYMDTYEFQLSEFDPVRQAVGNQNNDFGAVPAIPRWRANARVGWSRGPHILSVTTRYIHSVRFDANQFAFQRFFPFSNFRFTEEIRPWTAADAFYSYRGIELFGGNLSLTAGMRNMFDREAQKTGMIAGVDTGLQDPLGRVVYGRMNFEF